MKKPIAMLALGGLLIAGFFLFSRRASAESLFNGGGGGGGGATGALAPGTDLLFPGGGTSPLAFEGATGGVSTRGETGAKGTTTRFSPRPLPSSPRAPVQPSQPVRLAPLPGAQPRLGTVRRAQGVTDIPKGGVRRFLN